MPNLCQPPPNQSTAHLASIHPGVWRADQLAAPVSAVVPSGFASLDAVLPGQGWPVGTLTELLIPQSGIGEIQLLMPGLHHASTSAQREVVWVAPPYIPCAPALQQQGLTLSRLTIVSATQPMDALWAAEQALKSSACGALVLWCDRVPSKSLRRLHWAAQTSQVLTWVIRPQHALAQSSPAPLRLSLAAAAGRRLRVDIPKRRGPALAQPLLLDLPRPMPLRNASHDHAHMASILKAFVHALDRHPFADAAARSTDTVVS